ncbi:hypothetical protein ABZZ44_32270 [Streptomyces sp. NPDC006460]|uniref:hypothetical protein n=1 Tax=Streptomyces sp. NPDC006460 TaxID=3154304 RepID=UPI0033A7FD3B
MRNEPAVAIEGVHQTFGPVRALDGVDLGIRRGETVALPGRAARAAGGDLGSTPGAATVTVIARWALVLGAYAVVSYGRAGRTA